MWSKQEFLKRHASYYDLGGIGFFEDAARAERDGDPDWAEALREDGRRRFGWADQFKAGIIPDDMMTIN